jgi:hypothetical protein
MFFVFSFSHERTIDRIKQFYNFCRHSLVRHLRSQIDSHLGNLIDDEIEKHSMSATDAVAGQETLVSQISSKILLSKQ